MARVEEVPAEDETSRSAAVEGDEPAAGQEGHDGHDGEDGQDDELLDDELDEAVGRRRGRTALAISVVMALVVGGFVAVLATREPAQNRRADSPLVGQVAPPLSGETLDGGSFDIEDHQGRWVVVNFFATWCAPCRQEHPELVTFDETHRRLDDAVLVSVLYDDDPDTAAEYFEQNGGEWPVVLDADGAISVSYGVGGVPETYLVSPDGVVYGKLTGGVTQDGLEDFMAELSGAGQ